MTDIQVRAGNDGIGSDANAAAHGAAQSDVEAAFEMAVSQPSPGSPFPRELYEAVKRDTLKDAQRLMREAGQELVEAFAPLLINAGHIIRLHNPNAAENTPAHKVYRHKALSPLFLKMAKREKNPVQTALYTPDPATATFIIPYAGPDAGRIVKAKLAAMEETMRGYLHGRVKASELPEQAHEFARMMWNKAIELYERDLKKRNIEVIRHLLPTPDDEGGVYPVSYYILNTTENPAAHQGIQVEGFCKSQRFSNTQNPNNDNDTPTLSPSSGAAA